MRLAGDLGRALAVVGLLGMTAGCTQKKLVLDLYGSVVYEKPEIAEVAHTVRDDRTQGGPAVVRVTILGDPGLAATFDIYPGIVERHPMHETAAGSYVGELEIQGESLGGTFTITGRLEHPDAGEAVRRDPAPLFLRRLNAR